MDPTLSVVELGAGAGSSNRNGRNPFRFFPGRLIPGRLVPVLLAVAMAGAACSTTTAAESTADTVQPAVTASVVEEPGATDAVDSNAVDGTSVDSAAADAVSELVASLTVEQKIGQLLMPVVFGTGADPSPSDRELNLQAHGYATPNEIVEAYQLGGVIYLPNNVESAAQLRTMSSQLQETATQDGGVGLLVAVDQEGGRVSRISEEVTSFPPPVDLAGDAGQVREASYVTGQQVQQQGVNVVLAPVADVWQPGSFIGNRSFGGDPAVVSTMVAAAVDGLQQSGVAAAVKHWPGHGATPEDSHEKLPTLDVARSLWEERDLPPFRAAIDQDVSIVLVGHLALSQFDPSGVPATISPILIDGLLREEQGFDGVVMSDALNMGAVDNIPPQDLAVASVQAGIDVILIPPSLELASEGLTNAVASGEISQERLDLSVTRILRLKQQLGLL